MDDKDIIRLLEERDEKAIDEIRRKYGALVCMVAGNILKSPEDAEECEQDAYLALWNRVPPEKPSYLKNYLIRIVRNFALDRFRRNHRSKRYAGMELLLSELEECIPDDRQHVEEKINQRLFGEMLDDWLRGLSPEERALFIRRYWYGSSVKELAKQFGKTENQMSRQFGRMRQSLKKFLTEHETWI